MKFKSVYERSYKQFASAHKDYLENLNYRIQRQADERTHHPLDWPGESSDSDTSSSSTVIQGSHVPLRAVSAGNSHNASYYKTSIGSTQLSQCTISPEVKKDEFVQVDWDSSLSELSLASDGSDSCTINTDKARKVSVGRAPRCSGDVKDVISQYPTGGASKGKTHSLPLQSLENRDAVPSNNSKHRNAASCKQLKLSARNSCPKTYFTGSQSNNSVQSQRPSVRFTSCPTRKHCEATSPLTDSWTSEYTSKFAPYPSNVYSKSAAALASQSLPHSTSKAISRRIRNANVDKITARMSSNGNPNYILDKP